MAEADSLRILVGLGNPGAEYANTRHNIGFLVLNELANRRKQTFAFDAHWDAEVAKAGNIWLLRPMTFMNLSGESVSLLAQYYKVAPAEVLVITDDAALPLGNVRLRKDGGAGGHHGLESVLMHLGTSEVPRLRVGIGAPQTDMQDHVLSRFTDEEAPLVTKAVARAADAVEHALTQGVDAAMNLYNQNTL